MNGFENHQMPEQLTLKTIASSIPSDYLNLLTTTLTDRRGSTDNRPKSTSSKVLSTF